MTTHPIEEKVNTFLVNGNTANEAFVAEFANTLGESLYEKFYAKVGEVKPFSLRMSNIGLSLRQLCLQRDYGRTNKLDYFTLHSFYGTMLECFMLFLLKASGVNVEANNKKVQLDVNGYILPGELDVIIDGAVWDIKSASDYAFTNKFQSYQSLESDDGFGYLGQGFGYAMAEDKPFGGWIVINKAKGQWKCVPVPASVQKFYKEKYFREFDEKIKHVTSGAPAPKCTGVVPEFFRKKMTGNKILGNGCEWCSYKDKCHPGYIELPSLLSDAKVKPVKYYTKIDPKYQAKVK
jgi:hypothetical protein